MAINKMVKSEEESGVFEETQPKSTKRKWKIIAIIIIIILIIGAVACVLYRLNVIPSSFLDQFHRNYQAVFLTNGQVYFGKLYRQNSLYPTLRDVYYLQVTQAPQPIQPGQTPPTNINLVKLGGELHSPQDEMRISRNQILFIEDLRPDSRVVQAIQQTQAHK